MDEKEIFCEIIDLDQSSESSDFPFQSGEWLSQADGASSAESTIQNEDSADFEKSVYWEESDTKDLSDIANLLGRSPFDDNSGQDQNEPLPPIAKGQRLKKRSDEKNNKLTRALNVDSLKKKIRQSKINFEPRQHNEQNGRGLPKKNENSFRTLKTWQKVLVIVAAVFIVACIVGFTAYQLNRQDISDYAYTTKEKTQVFSSDGAIIAEMFAENRTYISIDQVPQDLKNAIVATEDSRFYTHGGVDLIGIVRSLVSNVLSLNLTGQGGSTITQQLARTLFLPSIETEDTTFDSINRKMKEISIAWQLDQKYTKDQILEMYLNETYFGSGAYGVEEAAKTYFGKSVSECNLAECAMLAGLPQAPSAYAPNSDFEMAKARQAKVLSRMVSEGYITQEEADQAANAEIVIVPWSPESLDDQIRDGFSSFVNYAFQEYAENRAPEVMKQQGLSEEEAISYIRTELASGGYKIYTTVDSRFQDVAVNCVSETMSGFGDNYTGALVTLDGDGAIRAYYGGKTDIDMADTTVQPGSGIKPLYYSCAFEKEVATPYTTVEDEPTTFYGTYTPHNDEDIYRGTITYETALVESSNICSIKLFDQLGPETAIEWMKNLGITSFVDGDYNLATAIGGMTHGISPLEMAGAYNVMNNSGIYNQPYAVTEIQKTNGETIFTKDSYRLDSHRAMKPETAQTMWEVLQGVVWYGTGTSASNSLPTAGKTGTADEHRDLWFNGMTAAYTTSIWCGSPDHEVVNSTSHMVAGIYGNYMQTLYNNGVVTDESAEEQSWSD